MQSETEMGFSVLCYQAGMVYFCMFRKAILEHPSSQIVLKHLFLLHYTTQSFNFQLV